MAAEWVGIAVSGLLALAALVVSIVNRRATTAAINEGNRKTDEGNAIAQRAFELAEQQATRYVTPWKVEYENGDKYRLQNAGDEIAHNVTISGSNVPRGPVEQELVHHCAAMHFFLTATLADPDTGIVVTWYRDPQQPDEQRRWRTSAPSRPKRSGRR